MMLRRKRRDLLGEVKKYLASITSIKESPQKDLKSLNVKKTMRAKMNIWQCNLDNQKLLHLLSSIHCCWRPANVCRLQTEGLINQKIFRRRRQRSQAGIDKSIVYSLSYGSFYSGISLRKIYILVLEDMHEIYTSGTALNSRQARLEYISLQ
ncbi:hypothetical protein YC2023_088859 [Brassica napus]